MQAIEWIGRALRRFLREMQSLARVIRISCSFSSSSCRFLASLLQRARLYTKFVYIYESAGFRLNDNTVSRQMFYNVRRRHGTADIHFLQQLLRLCEQLVDMGANVGSRSIAIAKYFGDVVDVGVSEVHSRTSRRLSPEPIIIERVYLQTLHFIVEHEWDNWVATRSEAALLQHVPLRVQRR